MLTGVLTLTGAILALHNFARGRAVCPRGERLPLEQLDGAGVIQTIGRGWMTPDLQSLWNEPRGG
ncbi:MAG: hypothetical protein ACTHVY_08530 [Brevibacterium yomogidense]|uniref:hypothetical protein n=1 Tax=Brevibacterium sp. Mu109 TaxID=1255669 RepID=UPI000C51C4DD|nr:hypothetical protein [Brevibacterium sp. Mu109]SMX79954.1 hypothetical protein BSP109_01582 [Brevibacterium sp. Mu109]